MSYTAKKCTTIRRVPTAQSRTQKLVLVAGRSLKFPHGPPATRTL